VLHPLTKKRFYMIHNDWLKVGGSRLDWVEIVSFTLAFVLQDILLVQSRSLIPTHLFKLLEVALEAEVVRRRLRTSSLPCLGAFAIEMRIASPPHCFGLMTFPAFIFVVTSVSLERDSRFRVHVRESWRLASYQKGASALIV